jgi:hypothetical protein
MQLERRSNHAVIFELLQELATKNMCHFVYFVSDVADVG